MSTPFDSSLLSGYLDGELDADETALVERVLEEQPERLRELENLRHLQRSLATLPAPQPTADPVAAVRARIDQKRPLGIRSSRPWWLQVAPFALAACLLLAVGWAMFGTGPEPAQLASDQEASRPSETAAERAERFARPEMLFDEDSARLPRQADQVEAASQPPELQPPESMAERSRQEVFNFNDQRSQSRSSQRQQQTLGSSESGAPAMRSPAPADAEREAGREKPSSSVAMALGAAPAEPLQLNMQSGTRLRYEVPPDQQAETVRWLRTVAPRELKELPTAGDVKRYLFFGDPQERQDLQEAIKKRLEFTAGRLNVVQSTHPPLASQGPDGSAASTGSTKSLSSEPIIEEQATAGDIVEPSTERASGEEKLMRGMARAGGSPSATRSSDSDARPAAIVIELLARPEP